MPLLKKLSFLEGQEGCLILLITFVYLLLIIIVHVANAKLHCSFNIPRFHLWLARAMCAHRAGGSCSSQQPSAFAAALPTAFTWPWQFVARWRQKLYCSIYYNSYGPALGTEHHANSASLTLEVLTLKCLVWILVIQSLSQSQLLLKTAKYFSLARVIGQQKL